MLQESFSESNDADIKGADDGRVSRAIDDKFGAASSNIDREHVRGTAGHRDDVGPQRFAMNRGHHPESVEHFGDAGTGRDALRHELAALREHVGQEIHAPRLRPARVLPETKRTCDGVDRFRVPLRFLLRVV